MPLYDYECRNCGYMFEASATVDERRDTRCPKCMGECEVLIRTSPGVVVFEPYFSPTFRKKVSSKKEKRRLMNARGFEEFDSIDEVHAVAERNRRDREKEEEARKPDEKFYQAYEKAKAMFPE